MMDAIYFLYVTTPDEKRANEIAGALVEQRLAACVNMLAPIRSVYVWDGAVTRNEERPLIVKTTAARIDAATALIKSLHPDDEPCIAAIPIDDARSSDGFMAWIRETVSTENKYKLHIFI